TAKKASSTSCCREVSLLSTNQTLLLPGAKQKLPKPPAAPKVRGNGYPFRPHRRGRDELPYIAVASLTQQLAQEARPLCRRSGLQQCLEVRNCHGIVPEKVGHCLRIRKIRR